MTPRAWTVGYEGLSVAALLEALKEARVETLIDVRERPLSRKAGFSKGALSKAVGEAGLHYIHIGALGSPASARNSFKKDGDFAKLRRAYLTHLRKQSAAIGELEGLLVGGPCALLCYEREVAECHRGFLCAELEKEGYAFSHLRPPLPSKPARSSGARLSDFA